MASSDVQRKLTAILCADVVSYSRLMGENEAATTAQPYPSSCVIRGLTSRTRHFADAGVGSSENVGLLQGVPIH